MTELPRLAHLVLNQPHHITPEAAETILGVLGERIGVPIESTSGQPDVGANAFVGRPVRDHAGSWRGYRVTDGGVGIISVQGELVNRGAWLGSYSGLVSYEGLRHALRNAAADRDVKAIVLDIDSPGGMAAGMLETAALVRSIAAKKVVIAVANALMASAAYGIASGATLIVTTETGYVGSVGTVIIHVDRSRQLAKRGLAVTLIHAGARKVDGHPYAPLPDEVRAMIQERVEAVQRMFVAAVAEGRKTRGLTEDRIRATEARLYLGVDAVRAGLADMVATFDQVVALTEAATVITAARREGSEPRQSAVLGAAATTPAPARATALAMREARFDALLARIGGARG